MAEPVAHIAGLPVYAHGTAPAHLRSRTRLHDEYRLQRAPGQRPICYVQPWYHPDDPCPLYDPADAIPLPEQSVGAAWAYRSRRTCPKCGQVGWRIVHGSECGACWRARQERLAAINKRTCTDCHRVGRKPYPTQPDGAWNYARCCRACAAKRRRKRLELLATAIRCPGCGKRTTARAAALAWVENRSYGALRHFPRRRCPQCDVAHRAEQERRKAFEAAEYEAWRAEETARAGRAREARRCEIAELAAWAAEALADPNAVILDTETTGLYDDARIVQIAVITPGRKVLLDTLVNPGEPIPADATAIHGITDANVADAPEFGEILTDLELAVVGRRVLIYNADFDAARLKHELALRYAYTGGPEQVARWFAMATWEDAMIPYSDWVGDWSDYHGNNRWQPLNGGHDARTDCLAVVDRLEEMAASLASVEVTQ